MNLLIVASYQPDQQYSLLSFAQALRRGMAQRGIEVQVLAPHPIASRLGRGEGQGASRRAKWLGHLDKVVLFPWQLKAALRWADVVHLVDHGLAIYTKYLQAKPHVVTCNDLIAMRAMMGDLPEWATAGTSGVFQRMILDGLNRAQHVACISQATQSDLQRLTQAAPHNISVVYDGLFHSFEPIEEAQARPLLEKLGVDPHWPFLLHIGRNVPTKNRKGVIDIFAALRRDGALQSLGEWHLVMAGGALAPELRTHAASLGLNGLMHEMPHMEDREVQALYSRAQALVFPSFYEGFGLPIIEAQACGCPVFTSDRAPMTEVGGQAARYFDPARPDHGAQVIAKYLGQPQQRQAMIDAGFANVLRFSPDKMCDQYIEIYHRVVVERSSRRAMRSS